MNIVASTKNPTAAPADANLDATMKSVEFELALGTEDIRANGFEACIESAAKSAGFKSLFNLPVPVNDRLQRLAAVACIENDEPIFTFIALNNDGDQAILHPDLSSLPHIEKFAEAFFELLVD